MSSGDLCYVALLCRDTKDSVPEGFSDTLPPEPTEVVLGYGGEPLHCYPWYCLPATQYNKPQTCMAEQ